MKRIVDSPHRNNVCAAVSNMGILIGIVLVIVNIPLVLGLGWLFFGDWQAFLRTLLYSLQWILSPIIVTDEEHAATFEPLKLAAFLFTCAAFGYLEYLLLAWLGLAK
jgi:hypothetical protein